MGFDRGLMEADSASHQGRGALVHLTLAPIFVATLFGPSTLGLEPWRLDLGPSNFEPLVLPEVPGDHFGTQDAPKRVSWELLGSHVGTFWDPRCYQKSLFKAFGEPFWDLMGPGMLPKEPLESLWGPLGDPGVPQGPSCVHLGSVLGSFWGSFWSPFLDHFGVGF